MLLPAAPAHCVGQPLGHSPAQDDLRPATPQFLLAGQHQTKGHDPTVQKRIARFHPNRRRHSAVAFAAYGEIGMIDGQRALLAITEQPRRAMLLELAQPISQTNPLRKLLVDERGAYVRLDRPFVVELA
jgi:hypothetical protein